MGDVSFRSGRSSPIAGIACDPSWSSLAVCPLQRGRCPLGRAPAVTSVSSPRSDPVLLCASHFIVVQSPSRVRLFATPWTAAHQASLSLTISRSLPKFMNLLPSNHLVLCCPLLLPPSIFPSIRVLTNESALHIRWPKYWSFSISPSSEYSGLVSFRMDWFEVFRATTHHSRA